jgi:UDP-2-acetamido-2-deoxy-ribo-hexuluronate aminotransferase
MRAMTQHPKIPRPIPFIDLQAQRRRLGARIDDAIARVVEHGQYILGPEVRTLERELAQSCGAGEVVSCANGTDALALVLMAQEVKAGDAVLCPSFTFSATAEVVAWFGATPLFVDIVPDTFNMDARSLTRGIEEARRLGLNPVGVIPVDLFGHPADYHAIEPVCEAHGLWMLSDAAQSFGATYRNRKVGTIGLATSTSFYPSKPFGCYGDGGAIFTDDSALADLLRSLRNHGEGTDKYDAARIGLNSRLDTIQAAVLLQKLEILPDEIDLRNRIARRYNEALADVAIVPTVHADCVSIFAQYTIRVRERDRLAVALKAEGIPTAIHYAQAVHQQRAYRDYPVAGGGLPVTEQAAREVISLPMHPYLGPEMQDRIISCIRRALR